LAPFCRALRVAVEAGGQTVWIVDVLRELGAVVHVVHPLKVKWIAESKKKTDRVDAELLAGLLRIGGLPAPVHVPSRRCRELRGLLLARRQLVQTRTKLINVVRGLARQQQVTLPARALQYAAGWERLRPESGVEGRRRGRNQHRDRQAGRIETAGLGNGDREARYVLAEHSDRGDRFGREIPFGGKVVGNRPERLELGIAEVDAQVEAVG